MPRFMIAVTGELEGQPIISATIYAESQPDEQRLWRWILDHPVIGDPLRELLATVDLVDLVDLETEP